MFDLDKWTEIWHVLSKNKFRTFLTGLGVFTGMFILVILLASSDGLQRGVMGEYQGVSANSFFVWRGTTTMAYKGYNPGRRVRPVVGDAQALEQEIPEIDAVFPRCGGRWAGSINVTRNGVSEGYIIRGDYPGVYEINPIYTLKGRFLNDKDIELSRKVAVIGTRVFKVLFEEGENPIGQYIEFKGAFFQVIGVMDSHSPGRAAEDEQQSVYIPITAYQKLFKTGDYVNYLHVSVKDEYLSSDILKKSMTVLQKQHSIHPDDNLVFGNFDLGKEFSKINSLFSSISLLMWIVGVGTLLSGVIGVSNIMLIVVKERTQEFGIMRAIGAAPIVVKKQVIMESAVLTAFFGVIGFMIGVAVVEFGVLDLFFIEEGSTIAMFKNPTLDFNTSLISLLLIVVFGVMAGWLPAQRAIKVKPVEAIQTE